MDGKEKNNLIEVDGDYWYSNPEFFSIRNGTQIKNALNDEFKNKIANEFGFRLIRFWENEIKRLDFKNKFMEIINE
jgi:very-short-patch-repair endonuclease